MLNSFMQTMYTKIHESLDDKTTDFIKKKAQSLGNSIFIQESKTNNITINKG